MHTVFLLLLGASTRNLSQGAFSHSVQVCDPYHIHYHHSKLWTARAVWPANACPDWKLPTLPEMEPLQEHFLHRIVGQKEINGPPVLTKQLATAAAVCTAFHALVSCPAHVRLLTRNGLVNKVEFLGLQWDCEIGNYYEALPYNSKKNLSLLEYLYIFWASLAWNGLNIARWHVL